MTKDSVCIVLDQAGIQSSDLEKVAKLLDLNSFILPVAFFNQWSAIAHECCPSWKALAKAIKIIQNDHYKQAAIEAHKMEGMYVIY